MLEDLCCFYIGDDVTDDLRDVESSPNTRPHIVHHSPASLPDRCSDRQWPQLLF